MEVRFLCAARSTEQRECADAGALRARQPVKYFVRGNSPADTTGPFDLERARARLRATLQSARGRGQGVHEGQRGIWLIELGDDGTRLCWISDEDDEIVRLDERAALLQ
jgi:hypothetical protein